MSKRGAVVAVAVITVAGLSITVGNAVLSSRGEPGPANKTAPAKQSVGDKPATTRTDSQGVGMAAMEQAAGAKKYLFAFFWKTENEQTAAMQKVFEETMTKMADRAQSVVVRAGDPLEKRIIDKFGLDRAPMPLVLAIAPNGAVMGGFPTRFTEEALLESLGSPCTERCMKALQDGKLVLLCVQNGSTTSNDGALAGVREFKADERYASATEIVMLDPADPVETRFLEDLKIDPKTAEAVTAFLAPPGSAIAEFTGATDKEELIAALKKAGSGCCPGGSCGPGGCGP